jgi:HEAT repeat protein
MSGDDRVVTDDEQLAALVAEGDDDRRWERLRAFAIGDKPGARSAGELGLAANDSLTRTVAADLLGSVASVDPTAAAGIASVLITALDTERNTDARASMIFALGHAGDPRGRAAVVARADDPNEDVRMAAAWALPSLGLDENALTVLRRLSTDIDEDVRDWATFGLAESDAEDAATTGALAARTDDLHDDTRAEAIFGLARRHDPRARGLIEREMSRPVHGTLIERALEEFDE